MREPNGTDGTWLTSFALVVSGFWFGYTTRRNVAAATGKPAVAMGRPDNPDANPYEDLIAECHADTLRGFERRLAAEVEMDRIDGLS